MSRAYGKVVAFFWQSAKIKRLTAPPSARELLSYLFSSPHGNAIGCFVARMGYLEEDLGWTRESILPLLEELVAGGHIERDADSGLVRITGWFKHNYFENENVAKGAGNAFKALPLTTRTKPILDNLINELMNSENLVSTKYRQIFYGVATASILTEPNRTEPIKTLGGDFEKDFREWYEIYPRHDDPGHGLKAYVAARKKPGVTKDILLAGATKYRVEKAGTEKKYIALPSTWLNGERWLDRGAVPKTNGVTGNGDEFLWRCRLDGLQKTGLWLEHQWGPPPGQPGCQVPPALLLEPVRA